MKVRLAMDLDLINNLGEMATFKKGKELAVTEAGDDCYGIVIPLGAFYVNKSKFESKALETT